MSEHVQRILTKSLKSSPNIPSTRQICAVAQNGAKNLAKVEIPTKNEPAGATGLDLATIKGKIIEFAWWLQKEGYDEETIKVRASLIKRLVKLGANLYDPETIKVVLGKQKWNNGYKRNFIYAYTSFLKMEKLTWDPPKYKQPQRLAFIPTELELNQLINAASKKTGAFLQGLKETGADPGELGAIEWIDIDRERKTIRINYPVKGHNPRILSISEEFINRLSVLPKKNEKVFDYHKVKRNFYKQRKTIAQKLGNPRLKQISFTTFRHWKGTMEYHRTRDILYVQRLLGHKSLQSTMIYIDYEKACFGSPCKEEFSVRVATNVEEACKLAEVGFEYVTGEYHDGGKIFRKRK